MKLLNKAQVDAMFERVAILIGSEDGVPDFCAAELFGEEAIRYVTSFTGGHGWNRYYVGSYSCEYLTRSGFQVAATFHNLQQFQEAEDIA